jgi:hypothetical protein
MGEFAIRTKVGLYGFNGSFVAGTKYSPGSLTAADS